MYYLLQSGATDASGNSLYLSVNLNSPTGPLMIDTLRPGNQASQAWSPVLYVNNSNGNSVQGTGVQNQLTGLFVSCDGNKGDQITQVAQSGVAATLWNICDKALQFTANDNLNLNISGNGPYDNTSTVISWSWGGGDPNESWYWVLIS